MLILQEIYGEFAFFFYDVYGGDFIGIIWKKTAFTPKELKVCLIFYTLIY